MDYIILESVYPPAEDSYLFVSIIEKMNLKGKKILDMGCGCGILGITTAFGGGEVLSCDINKKAVENTILNAKRKKIQLRSFTSDLFSNININEKFDFIFFNAPYLPQKPKDDLEKAWAGGKKGREVIDRFLEEAPEYLEKNGKILLLQSSISNLNKTKKKYEKMGFNCDKIAERAFFFERIAILEILKKQGKH